MKINTTTPTHANVSVLSSKRNLKSERHSNHSEERKGKNEEGQVGSGNVAFPFQSAQVKPSLVDVGIQDGNLSTAQSDDTVAGDPILAKPFGSLFEKFENRLSEQEVSNVGGKVTQVKPTRADLGERGHSVLTPDLRQIPAVNDSELTQNYIQIIPDKPRAAQLVTNEFHVVSQTGLNVAATQVPANQTAEFGGKAHAEHDRSSSPTADATVPSIISSPLIDLNKNLDGRNDANSDNQQSDRATFKVKAKSEAKTEAKMELYFTEVPRGQVLERGHVPGNELEKSMQSLVSADTTITRAAVQLPVANVASQISAAVSRIVPSAASFDLPNGQIKTLLLRLQPEGLGQLEIALKSKNGVLNIHLTANTDEALRAIQQGSDELKKSLSSIATLPGQVELAFSLSNQDTSNQHTNEGNREGGVAWNQAQAETGNSGESGDHARGSNGSRNPQNESSSVPGVYSTQVAAQTGRSDGSDVYL